MERRAFDSIKEPVSLLGYGAMRFPLLSEQKKDIDRKESQRLIDRALEGGINYFDTAWLYHDGESEGFLGEALGRHPRESYFLATKMPTWDIMHERGDVERIFSEQLRRCRVDYFDFYLLHGLSEENLKIAEQIGAYEFLLREKERGRIRNLGFSFHDHPGSLEQIVARNHWDFAQIQLNYIDWVATRADRQYEILEKAGVPIIIMEPVRGGALAVLCEEAAALLKDANPEASLASWAMRFAASLPGVLCVLSGMSNMEQLEDNLRTFSNLQPLNAQEKETLWKAADLYRASGVVPCTGCSYCMPCPSGVNIPRIFSVYNHYHFNHYRLNFDSNYRSLRQEEQAHHCISCGVCKRRCPQGIDIPKWMNTIADFAANG